jgi:rubrerythrin
MAAQASSYAFVRPEKAPAQKFRLRCAACGYGAVRRTPPERCPMCQAVEPWVHAPWRPFSSDT